MRRTNAACTTEDFMEDKKITVKDYFLFANLALALLIWVGDCLYIRYNDSLLIKSITSALFVVIGIVNLVYLILNKFKLKSLLFPIMMLTGLTFAMLGDIILEVEFIVGAALFAVGHVFFFVSYVMIEKFKWQDLIYGACIFVPAVLLITLAPIFDFGGAVMEIVAVIYAAVISCMVGKAIANFVSARNKLTLIILLGSALFFVSDFALLFNVFSKLPYFGAICLATYYPAEILLGFSVFLFGSSAKVCEPKTAASEETPAENAEETASEA